MTKQALCTDLDVLLTHNAIEQAILALSNRLIYDPAQLEDLNELVEALDSPHKHDQRYFMSVTPVTAGIIQHIPGVEIG